MQAPNMGILVPGNLSRLEFYCITDSHYFVLSDEATFMGIYFKNKQVIIKENILKKAHPVVQYTGGESKVGTFSVNESNNTVLAGEYFNGLGRVIQYDLETGKIIRNYGSIGVDLVNSSTNFRSFWFFGGIGCYHITVIDIITREIALKIPGTAIRNALSLAIADTNDQRLCRKVLLVVTGSFADYTKSKTDVFDITRLIDRN